ncbi:MULTISPECIES: GxxExxY protein [Asticcacaulis]|uniref:GxxExxY protein n=1 Tax=Asticcacaulis TaxID=76890 RepID=UPI00285CFFE8|nr:GxxExxY protein [Asticcacaulis sp. BE141]MBP2159926.1 GxxExxY protein [Asticcacaulis solisilvae]MDR6800971.1 GxxExxY protein [Asticcacaulis sp. BE141]
MTNQKDAQTYAIIGAAMEVHRTLGHGFLEAVYHEAMVLELSQLNVPFLRECAFPISYKGMVLSCQYRADLVCFEAVLVELKALTRLTGDHEAQTLNYLKASGLKKALLINFGAASLEYRRFVA